MKEGGGNIRKEVKRELERIAECAKRERESEKAGDISFALGWPREYCHCMSAGGSHFFPSSSALYRVELVLHATFTHHICVARVSQSAQYLAAAFVCMRGCALSLYSSLIHCRFCRLFHATLWKAKIWRRRCPVSSLSSCSMCSSSSSPSSAFHCSSPFSSCSCRNYNAILRPQSASA